MLIFFQMSYANGTCIWLTRNETHHMYKVSLSCHNAVGYSLFGSVTVYSHQALMINGNERGRTDNLRFSSNVIRPGGIQHYYRCMHRMHVYSFLSSSFLKIYQMLFETLCMFFLSEIYTIVMECETFLSKENKTVLKPEFRLFEHRLGHTCSSSVCPHGDLCLPKKRITGYFCECTSAATGICGGS